MFPEAKVARMDLDTTRSKHSHKQMIDDFESGQTNILVGTQMVTKGLDFENVSVVGVINVDSVLNFPDFRSFERAYQLLTQLKGRAGRKNHPGKLFIQTNQPQHPVLLKLMEGDQEQFYKDQLLERDQFNYPPVCRLIELNILSKDTDELTELSNKLAYVLKQQLQNKILGPEFPLIAKIRNMYTKRILIKVDKQVSGKWIREFLSHSITQLHSEHQKWKFIVQINVDPF
ncbi:MAG: hypothetical protein IPG08_09460 [Sphingobacteriaceae bacterium]|nr:hypothetical protein [Sphingobacteriaceae bacterium]